MAPVISNLRKIYGQNIQVCITAQHREMLDQVLKIFKIVPNYDLNIMQANQTLTQLSSRLLVKLEEVLKIAKPDRILVHGDTTTTFIASLAAFYQQIPVAHIEAGLRSGNIYSPWPEEANRRLSGILADCHFAPTQVAADNLLREGYHSHQIHITGNTVIDALLMTQQLINQNTDLHNQFIKRFNFIDPNKKLLLITGHRRESFGKGFEQICNALAKIAQRKDIQLIYPVHLNPNVQKPVKQYLSNFDHIHLIEPLDYLPFVYLMTKAHIILTDSGGIQEEAPALGTPVLVMRDVTERPEAIIAGTAKLVGSDSEKIYSAVIELLDNSESYQNMSQAHNPYGDGTASQKISAIIQQYHPIDVNTVIS